MFGRKKRFKSHEDKIIESILIVLGAAILFGLLTISGAVWIIWQTLEALGWL